MTTKPVQLSVFGVSPEKTETFNVYHDESGTDLAHARFQLHGSLIVPVPKFQSALQLLQNARNGYDGQIHFVKLRDNTKSPMSLIAVKWLDLFFNEISNYCFYKCMIIDMHSPNFNKAKFSTPHLLYNHSALLSVYGGVTWSLKKYDKVTLSIFSEAMSRASNDNFEEYLPEELEKRAGNNKKCPQVIISLERVTLVIGDPRKVEPHLTEHCEFIQLADILTGAVSQAINAKASQQIKIDLGNLVADWIGDTRMPPWLQENRLHRRFSVSCYDGNSKFYDVQLGILSQNQLRLEKF
jgi:hypothetical protein